MKIRSITFILMLGVVTLFSMCKKDKVSPPPNPGGGVDTTGNGNTNPRLVSFFPESGAIGDTVRITGVGFTGNADNLKVSFGNTPAAIIAVKATATNNVKDIVIWVYVPQMADTTTKISVKVDTMLLTSEKSFTRTSITQFSGFSPANGYIGDTITLTGAFYKNTPAVSFGDVSAKVISKDSKSLKVVVPDDIANATTAISVAVDGQTITSATSFHLNAPVIESISPTTAFAGMIIRIKGKGFRNSYRYRQVYLDNSLIAVSPESNTSLAFDMTNVSTGLHGFAVEVAGLKTLAKDSVRLIAPEITSITPNSVTEDDTLVIKGHHFLSPDQRRTLVTTTDSKGNLRVLSIQSITDDEIHVTVPILSAGTYKITINVALSIVTYATPVTYYEKPI